MNEIAIFGDKIMAIIDAFCSAQLTAGATGTDDEMSALTAFAIAVSGASLICFALMTRRARPEKRSSSPDGGGSNGGTYSCGD